MTPEMESDETEAERRARVLRCLLVLSPPPGRAWWFGRPDGELRLRSIDSATVWVLPVLGRG